MADSGVYVTGILTKVDRKQQEGPSSLITGANPGQKGSRKLLQIVLASELPMGTAEQARPGLDSCGHLH